MMKNTLVETTSMNNINYNTQHNQQGNVILVWVVVRVLVDFNCRF